MGKQRDTKHSPELIWHDKNKSLPLDNLTLQEVERLSYQTTQPFSCNTFFHNNSLSRNNSLPHNDLEKHNRTNLVIQGDNLPVLKALQSRYLNRVKCIYIDPPYNTGNHFAHYQDGLEHSAWLSFMRARLLLLKSLLTPDGFIACQIDDSENHYLKVLMDEIFGREHYLSTLYVQVRYPQKTLKHDMHFHKQIEQIHIYRKGTKSQPNLNLKKTSLEKYNRYITETGPGQTTTLGGKKVVIFAANSYKIETKRASAQGLKEIWASGSILDGNSSGRFFRDHLSGRVGHDGIGALYKVYGMGNDQLGYRYFSGPKRQGATKGKYYQGVPQSKTELGQFSNTPIENFYDLAASFGNCRHEGGVGFRSGKKPEALLEIIIKHFSNPGDIVLDAFAGSGTTGAVAHKMGRAWIMIESGKHCETHIAPRMKLIIDGEDKRGTATAGNGNKDGYHFLRLGPAAQQTPTVNPSFFIQLEDIP